MDTNTEANPKTEKENAPKSAPSGSKLYNLSLQLSHRPMNSNAVMPFTVYGQNGAPERASQLTKLEVAIRYGLSTRDLRVFDIPTSGFSHILVRNHTILIHMFDLRLLVQADRLLVFHIEEGFSHGQYVYIHLLIFCAVLLLIDPYSGHGHGHSISTSTSTSTDSAATITPFSDSTTVLDTSEEDRNVSRVFMHDLQQKISINNDDKDDLPETDSRRERYQEYQAEHLHHQLPFELRTIDAALAAVVSVLEAEYLLTNAQATKDLNMTHSDQMDSYESFIVAELGKTLALTRKLVGIEQRARQVRDAVGDVLNDDSDMAHMHLTEKLGGRPRPYDDHQDVEYLLEAYFKASDSVVQEAAALVDNIRRAEESVQSTLRVRRNQIMVLEAKIEVLMLAFATATLLAGLYGMNVPNHAEHVPGAFAGLVSISVVTIIVGSFYGLKRLRSIYKLRL